MCQAKVIMQNGEKSELLMEDVIHLSVEGDVVWLTKFFEPPKSFRATVQDADFLKHTVTLVPLDPDKKENR